MQPTFIAEKILLRKHYLIDTLYLSSKNNLKQGNFELSWEEKTVL